MSESIRKPDPLRPQYIKTGCALYVVVALLLLLSGCVGDQANRQSNNFGDAGPRWQSPNGTRSEELPLAVTGHEGGNWPRGKTVADAADYVSRNEYQQSNTATQNSITGLGVQLGKAADRIEGVHSEVESKIAVVAKTQADFSNDVKAAFQAQANISAKAVADLKTELTAEFNTKLEARIAAMGAGNAAAGVNNKSDSTQTTAGRDAVSFTPAMADMFVSMMNKFCEMTRAEMHTLAYTITAITSSFAGVMTTLAGLAVHRMSKHSKALVDHVVGMPGAEGKKITSRLPAVKS